MRNELADCEVCQHYRPQASFVDAWKQYDRNAPYLAVMKSLQEVRKAETETLENEVELLFELVRAEEQEWPSRPRFAPFCAARGGRHVAALKNSDGRCGDFERACGRDNWACHTCRFINGPTARIGGRGRQFSGGMSESERNAVRQENKDKDDADATAKGLEIEQAFFGDGRLPVVEFLPTCGVKMSEGARLVVPFANLRKDCPDHSPFLKVPPILLEKEVEAPDERALELTLALVKLVSSAGIDRPQAFLEDVRDWIDQKPERVIAAPWIVICILGRWASESGVPRETLTKIVSLPPFAMPATETLQPVIAGVDAFEWGLVARTSHSSDAAAENMAKAAIQQLAEYLVSVIRPLDGVRCIQSVLRLFAVPDLFAPGMLEMIDPFVRRLRVRADELRLTASTDLFSWYEHVAAGISYAVGQWLRGTPQMAQALGGGIGDIFGSQQLGEDLRASFTELSADARHYAGMILDRLARLDDSSAIQPAEEFLAQIVADNKAAAKRDEDMVGKILDHMPGRDAASDMAFVRDASALVGFDLSGLSPNNIQKEKVRLMIEMVLPKLTLNATLTILRGALPVTPAALTLMQRPASPYIPETPEQALAEPASATVEAMYPPRADFAGLIGRRQAAPIVRTIPPPPGWVKTMATAETKAAGRDLLARVIQAMGGAERLAAVKDSWGKAKVSMKTVQGEMVLDEIGITVFPDKFYNQRQTPMGPVTTVLTPGEAFVSNPKGIQPILGPMKEELSREFRRQTFVLAREAGEKELEASFAGKANVGATEAEVLDVSCEGTEVRWFVDPSSGRVVGSAYLVIGFLGPQVRVVEYADFRDVNGMTLPFKEVLSDMSGNTLQITTLEQVKLNTSPDLKLFDPKTTDVKK